MKSGTINQNDELLSPAARTPLTCLRCGKSWISYKRSNGKPKQCPECHSPYWNRKKKKFPKVVAEEARTLLSGPKLSMQDFEKELRK